MSARRVISNAHTGQTILARADICASFFSRLIGLQLRRGLAENEGLIFVRRSPSRVKSALHTLGMRFDIGVVWLDEEFRVVDSKLAKPWRLAHVPKAPAMYYLEADPLILERVQVGDQLRIDEVMT